MILSNVDILSEIDAGRINIEPLAGRDVSRPPFNTSSVDLMLARTLSIPQTGPINIRLDMPYDREFAARNSSRHDLLDNGPFELTPRHMILGQTLERVKFPMEGEGPFYAARIEGRSSLARYGLLVHFTAPTIHTGFSGPLTLEIINLGCNTITLHAEDYICQLIIEAISGRPDNAPNQFRGQTTPTG